MVNRPAHSLVEVLIALTLVSVGALGAAASITLALRVTRAARVQIERTDDARVVVAALQHAGCATDSLTMPVLLHPVEIAVVRDSTLRSDRVRVGATDLTHTRYCP